MNHPYQAGLINKTLCMHCKRDFAAHTKLASCESCPNIGLCDFVLTSPDILMCESCQLREREIQSEVNRVEDTNISVNDNKENRITELVNKLSKEIPLDARAFHVGEITSIVDIEEELSQSTIEGDKLTADEIHFKLAEIVHARLLSFKQNLFELKKIEAELRTDCITDQRYLNLLVPKLRAEEREKFKAFDISYSPTIQPVMPKAPVVRKSASDRAVESWAKMMGITVEAAKRAMEGVMTAKGIDCSCSITPGLCKMHPSA